MKCHYINCDGGAVIFREYEGRALCKRHFIRAIEQKVKSVIRKNNLIESGDSIAIALSGGKDSSVVLYLLKKFFGNRSDIKIFAMAVDEGIHPYRKETLEKAKEFCKKISVPLHIFSYEREYNVEIDKLMNSGKNKGQSACSFCGVFRRDVLNRKARELGANKLAIGHNLDDEVQGILMNYLKGDLLRLARMGAKTPIKYSDNFIVRIKPLREIPEREIALYALLRKLNFSLAECPYGHDSLRFEVRDFINNMENKHPTTKLSILRMYDKLQPFILKSLENDSKVNSCKICNEPTSGEICRKCQLLEFINGQEQ